MLQSLISHISILCPTFYINVPEIRPDKHINIHLKMYFYHISPDVMQVFYRNMLLKYPKIPIYLYYALHFVNLIYNIYP